MEKTILMKTYDKNEGLDIFRRVL